MSTEEHLQSALTAWEREPFPAGREAIMKIVPGFYQMGERSNRQQFVNETLDAMTDDEFVWIHSNCRSLGCPGFPKALHSYIVEGLYGTTNTTSDQDRARMRRCRALLAQWASEYSHCCEKEDEPTSASEIQGLPVEVHKLEG